MEPQNTKINYLQIIGKSLPLMSVFLVVIGYIKTHIFYTSFRIDITPYIALSDLPFIIPPDLIFVIPVFIFTSIPFVFLYKEEKKIESNIVKPNVIGYHYTPYDPKTDKSLIKLSKIMTIILAAMILYSLIQLIFVTNFTDRLTYFLNICVGCAMVWFFRNSLAETKFNSTTSIVLIILLVLIFPSLKLISSIRKVNLGFYNNTRVITKHDTITAKPDYIYVGGLSGYVFFYDKKKGSHTVIPRSEIIKLDVHQYEYPILEDSMTTK